MVKLCFVVCGCCLWWLLWCLLLHVRTLLRFITLQDTGPVVVWVETIPLRQRLVFATGLQRPCSFPDTSGEQSCVSQRLKKKPSNRRNTQKQHLQNSDQNLTKKRFLTVPPNSCFKTRLIDETHCKYKVFFIFLFFNFYFFPSFFSFFLKKNCLQLFDLIGNPGAESPGSTTPSDSGTPRSPRALTAVNARGLKNGHALPSEGCEKCVKRLKNPQTQSTTSSMDWSEAPPGSTGTCRRMLTATSTTTRTALAALPDCFLHCLDPFVPVVAQNGHGNEGQKLQLWNPNSLLHNKRCAYRSL